MTNSEQPETAPVPGALATVDGAAVMVAHDGTHIPVPADLSQRSTRYQAVIGLGRTVHQSLAGVFLPELREFMAITRAAYPADADPYAPGRELHEHDVIVRALEAFAAVIATGQAEATAAAAAATPAAV